MNEADKALAEALLVWFDTTHANGFGHDHHCPVPTNYDSPYARHERDAECTCGWTGVIAALSTRKP